jgi:hypothetical protein
MGLLLPLLRFRIYTRAISSPSRDERTPGASSNPLRNGEHHANVIISWMYTMFDFVDVFHCVEGGGRTGGGSTEKVRFHY